jgi:hypothetical protein
MALQWTMKPLVNGQLKGAGLYGELGSPCKQC